MRLDLRGKLLLLMLLLVAAVIGAMWLMLDVELTPTAEHATAIRTIVLLATAGAIVLAFVAAFVAVRMVRKTLARLAHSIQRGGQSDAAFPEEVLADVATTYQRLASDLVRVDSTLAEEHSRFDAVLRSIDAGLFAVDSAGIINVTNPAFLELFVLHETPIGKSHSEIAALAPLSDAIEEAQAGRSARVELQVTRGNERRIFVAHTSSQGVGVGVVVFVRDVTSMRHLERVRRDFVANISHELRTPVTVIQTNAETLLGGALDDQKHAREFVAAIERHASRMTDIIAGLLDLARLEAGQQSLAKEAVNLHAAAERAHDVVDTQANAKALKVVNNIPETLTVWADQKGVDQIVMNLLENAVKYTDQGGEVILSADAQRGWVRFTVADDGLGIAPEHRARVFERFYRVDKGRSRDTGGTGLGLAIVKHLTLAMGGEVGVEGREPRGSVFWVKLPAGRESMTLL